ncbi:HpcH/HpaI aldolase/citrate lyase family protein [Alisedimentitalea sp. MJ-SS2]|uniref:HpcH/HpaI aldolase family protein n=1 Tax=Aliisedimentitalea sp. MJ-SS2 TaxID=3049795 RepID=UPI00290BE4E2|nr:HpcH/HpaI aldolase/citrate lyase family protein [Alisedimentitalea sp. MJ-SS2]MDU8927075.1 HpcH/HpaI aldolase/citrate lyase family protein [Alisedimentitalea sp. MJ-SS2]
MNLPKNHFKHAILQGKQQFGLWSSIRDPAVSEMLAGCGYDWIVLDCEHSPRDVQEVLHGLHAMSAYPVEPVVRVKSLDVAEIKKMLDIGAKTILVPYIQNAEEARLAAAAVTYPPGGLRGVAGGTRANLFGAIPDYFDKARDEICLIVKIETREAMENLEEIVSTYGVDAIFVGPADLAASLGHPGNLKHPDVKAAIAETIRRVRDLGKPAGFLSPDAELLDLVFDAGSVFTAIDIDLTALRRIAVARLSEYHSRKQRSQEK